MLPRPLNFPIIAPSFSLVKTLASIRNQKCRVLCSQASGPYQTRHQALVCGSLRLQRQHGHKQGEWATFLPPLIHQTDSLAPWEGPSPAAEQRQVWSRVPSWSPGHPLLDQHTEWDLSAPWTWKINGAGVDQVRRQLAAESLVGLTEDHAEVPPCLAGPGCKGAWTSLSLGCSGGPERAPEF